MRISGKTERGFWLQLAEVCFNARSLRVSVAMAALIMLVVAQFQTGVSSGMSSIAPESPDARDLPFPATAILTIQDKGLVTVNGAIAKSGATILSGNAIQTHGQVAASINLRSVGAVEIAPNTTLTLEFTQKNSLKVILVKGCARLLGQPGTIGEIDTPQGAAGKTDPNTGGSLGVCFPDSANWAAAGAPDNVGHDGLFDLGKAATLAIIGGRIGSAKGVALVDRGNNPGPSAP